MMKKSEIKIGHVYNAKVTGKIVPVQIVSANPRGGWDGKNLSTGKAVRIKTAQRLRNEKPAAKPAATSPTRAKRAKKATKDATAATKRHTTKRGANGGDQGSEPKRLSILGAAAKVLAERDPADGPLNCTQMVERMTAKGYWQPARGGKTPANTLYSAILREIRHKGEDSRFDKVDRGKFSLSLKR